MIETLYECSITFKRNLEKLTGLIAFEAAVTAAEEKAKVREANKKHPDPNAHALGIWLRAVYEGLKIEFPENVLGI